MTRHRLTHLFIFISTFYFGQTWQWAKSGDGPGFGKGRSAAVDPSGNVFITGKFYSSIAFGSYTLSSGSVSDVFITKYDANGNVLWAKNSIGTEAIGYSVSTDLNGNVFITGIFRGSSISFGTYTLANSGDYDVFLAKYDSNGNVLWAKSAIGSGQDKSLSVSTDNNGNAYITGSYYFSPTITFDSYTLTNTGNENVFLTKYDGNGNVIWAKSTTGSENIVASSVSTDQTGNVYIGGSFNSPTISFGSSSLTTSGNGEMFLTKYDSNGNALWAKKSSGAQSGVASINTDSNGNPYVFGNFYNSSISFGSYTLSPGGGYIKPFIVKYDSNGNELWAKAIKSMSESHSIVSDANSIYVSGAFSGTVIIDTYTLIPPASSIDKIFIGKYDLNGNVTYATFLAEGGYGSSGLAIDKSCNLYISSDFEGNPSTFIIGTNTLVSTGSKNVFLAKLSFSCAEGINEFSISNNEILIFPNPNNGLFNIQMANDIKNGQLILINSLGQKIHEQKIIQGTNNITTNGLPVGLYNCILLDDNRQINSSRLLIE